MNPEPLVIRNPGYRRHGGSHEKWKLTLSPSRSDLVVQIFFFFVPESSPRDLAIGHGFACSFENKGKMLDFHTFGVQTAENKRKSGTASVELWSP